MAASRAELLLYRKRYVVWQTNLYGSQILKSAFP